MLATPARHDGSASIEEQGRPLLPTSPHTCIFLGPLEPSTLEAYMTQPSSSLIGWFPAPAPLPWLPLPHPPPKVPVCSFGLYPSSKTCVGRVLGGEGSHENN